MMEFRALYFDDKLLKVNPRGVIGVVTLWSKPEYVRERFREAGVDLDPGTSPIAVFGTLYGNGLREMLRNLLYNPQIQVLLLCGHDRSGSARELQSFFAQGVEPVPEAAIKYQSEEGAAVTPCRIRGTRRIIDGLVQPAMFVRKPRFVWLGDPTTTTSSGHPDGSIILTQIKLFFENFNKVERHNLEQAGKYMSRPESVPPLPKVQTLYFPSNPRGHQIIKENPVDAWLELVFVISRFGRQVTLLKGERLELQNVKVVVEKPETATEDRLLALGLDHWRFSKYFLEFLPDDPQNYSLRPDETYTYGHRLRCYFGVDAVEACAARLVADPEDRKAYFTLWDNARDLTGDQSRPCLVSVFFRKFAGQLTLTATFRTHNALDAWLMNLYGLIRLQEEVARRAGLPRGAITVFSHSISLDPRELDRALMLAGKRQWRMHLDPQGYFRVTLDADEILVEHRLEDITIKEYRGKSAIALQHQLARDLALSDVNHAMYLGRQLAKAEMALKEGREYIQD